MNGRATKISNWKKYRFGASLLVVPIFCYMLIFNSNCEHNCSFLLSFRPFQPPQIPVLFLELVADVSVPNR